MYCPECKYEYRDTVTICPDCNQQLVTYEKLQEIIKDEKRVKSDSLYGELQDLDFSEMEYVKHKIEWIQLARLTSKDYADMLLEALRAKEIPAVIHSETGYFGITGQIGMSSYRPIGGGYSLFVSKDHIVDADNEAKVIFGADWEKFKLVDIE